jgi:hypothetical protein
MQPSVRLAKLLFAAGFASSWLAARVASAQAAFVYINANPDRAGNSLTAFLNTTDGQSSPVAGSPFATGGSGLAPVAGAEFAHRIETAPSRNLLFAANDGSGTVSVFHVEHRVRQGIHTVRQNFDGHAPRRVPPQPSAARSVVRNDASQCRINARPTTIALYVMCAAIGATSDRARS